MKDVWFKQKRYGWGWYPSTWQGWLIILTWAAIYTLLIIDLINNVNIHVFTGFLLPIMILVAVLIAVCWMKGEKPRWRWG